MKRSLLLYTALLLPLGGCGYNGLVSADEQVKAAWAQVENVYQRRADLIPNLVATVKGSAKHEETVLQEVTTARASATQVHVSADDLTDPAKMKAFEEAQAKLSASAIGRLLVSNENYPKLQANGQFTDLMKQLEGTENRILRARQQYNESVKDYNSELGKIRGAVVNKATGTPFKPRVYFSASPESTAAPKVSF